jgi:hypothetical protein
MLLVHAYIFPVTSVQNPNILPFSILFTIYNNDKQIYLLLNLKITFLILLKRIYIKTMKGPGLLN